MSEITKRVELFGINVDNVSNEEAIRKIELLIKKNNPSLVVTPNVHHINILQKDNEFREIYSQASMVLPDSKPLFWTSKILKMPLKERVAGSDLLPSFCKLAAKKRYRLFFLGSGPGIARKAADILTEINPGLIIAGTYSPPFGFEDDEGENRKIVEMINKSNPDVLFVGLGAPKQEKWIWRYKDEINVPISIAVGAAFDFIAGNVKRAPRWMQKFGFEWFFRLYQEPRRLWKRYLIGNFIFLWLFLKESIK